MCMSPLPTMQRGGLILCGCPLKHRSAIPWQGYGIFVVLAAVFLAWNGYVYSKNA